MLFVVTVGRMLCPRLLLLLRTIGADLSPPIVGTSESEVYMWVILLTTR